MKIDVVVSFSGGRSSGLMSGWLKSNMSHVFNLHFIFANTGQEHPETLEFVKKCDEEFGLNLVWVEAVVNPEKQKGTNHKIVDYHTADRSGKPFRDVIAKYGLPNNTYTHCTRELKLQPMISWARSVGLKDVTWALGIRGDEPKRLKRKKDRLYPLADLINVDKPYVLEWWSKMPFDLNLPEHYGNCKWCFKKSLNKLATIAKERPDFFDFPLEMEILHWEESSVDYMFRERNRTADILQMAQGDFKHFTDKHYMGDCAEECGSVFIDEEIVL